MTGKAMRRRVWMAACWLACLGLVLEAGSRGFWYLRAGSFPLDGREILYAFYPGLYDLRRPGATNDEQLDVLVLAGSVPYPRWGNLAEILERGLDGRTTREVVLHNASYPAHTTLDSLNKYRRLAQQSYDLVLVYHGINDVRANNCPPAVFREDYTHYGFYAALNLFERQRGIALLTFPFTARYLASNLGEQLGLITRIPRHRPQQAWLAQGAVVRTARPFRANLEAILDLARERGEPVLLMTFAFHQPPDYSREAFDAGELDYAAHTVPTGLWGEPANVVAGVRAHDRVIEELARERDVPLVDQRRLIEGGARNFDDVCHLTDEGSQRFTENLMEIALALLGEE